jgi:hypothetical protein
MVHTINRSLTPGVEPATSRIYGNTAIELLDLKYVSCGITSGFPAGC